MTARRLRFCQLYAEGYSAKDAATLAGYSAESASANAFRLLKEPEVCEAVNHLTEERKKLEDDHLDILMATLSDIMLDENATRREALRAAHLMVQALKQLNRPRPKAAYSIADASAAATSEILAAQSAALADSKIPSLVPDAQDAQPPLGGAASQPTVQPWENQPHQTPAKPAAAPKPSFSASLRQSMAQQNLQQQKEKSSRKTIKNHHFQKQAA